MGSGRERVTKSERVLLNQRIVDCRLKGDEAVRTSTSKREAGEWRETKFPHQGEESEPRCCINSGLRPQQGSCARKPAAYQVSLVVPCRSVLHHGMFVTWTRRDRTSLRRGDSEQQTLSGRGRRFGRMRFREGSQFHYPPEVARMRGAGHLRRSARDRTLMSVHSAQRPSATTDAIEIGNSSWMSMWKRDKQTRKNRSDNGDRREEISK